MPMDIEIFVSNCHLCRQALEMVGDVKGPRCTLRVYDLSKKDRLVRQKSVRYGILAVPTIVGNGLKIFEGVPDKRELMACSLEHGCQGRLLK